MPKNKQVVFNVGGALSIYTETDNKTIINDLGKSDSFNPVNEFLLPLYKKRMSSKKDGKFVVNQLIISHPHKDHISAIEDFNEHFAPELLTCPNDRPGQADSEKIKWDLLGIDLKDNSIKTLRQMLDNRTIPLRTSINVGSNVEQHIFWIPPGIVEIKNELKSESYANNISILTIYRINGHTILMPGDLQKEGINHLLKNDYHDTPGHQSASSETLNNLLGKHRVCILVAPHHGLESAFSIDLFRAMYSGKTHCLNIISEKPNNLNENRNVDSRYASQDFCKGDNNLNSMNYWTNNYQRKTSNGHICIDYGDGTRPNFKIIQDTDALIDWFLYD